jgi:DNA end-binding protein Ku
MARAMWSGSITFGLVNVPIKLYTAVKEHEIHFHLLSPDGECRLRRKLVCPDTGEEFQFNQTVRGYEIAPDQYVIVQDEELKNLKPDAGRTIEITDFVDLTDIDPLYYNRPYYLAPDESGAKAYALLWQAMKESGKVGIAKFVMRGKEYLAAIRPLDELLCLETMHFDDEVLDAGELVEASSGISVAKKELDVAKQLVKALTTKFEPSKYNDDYREKVKELVEQKAAGEEVVVHEPEAEEAPRVINLMKALEESLQQARKAAPAPKRRRKSA